MKGNLPATQAETVARREDLDRQRLPSRAVWSGFAASIALLHLFRNGAGIGRRELWLDEAWTWLIAADRLPASLTLPISSHAQPPLYYLILHFVLELGSEEWLIRGCSWLAILALLGFVLFYLDELDRPARVLLCLMLVFHEYTRFLAQELRPYALATALAFVATILFVRMIERPDRRAAAMYASAELAALYTLAFNVWPFVCHALFLAVTLIAGSGIGWREQMRRVSPAILSFAVVSLLYLPYVLAAWSGHRADHFGASDFALADPAAYVREFRSFLFRDLSPWLTGIATAAALLAVGVRSRFGRPAMVLMVVIVVGQVLFVQAFLHGRAPASRRYYAPAFPMFWLLAAVGFAKLVPRVPKPVWSAGLAGVACVTAAFAVPFAATSTEPVPRTTSRQLRDRLGAIGGRKVVFFDPGYLGYPFAYEARHDRDIVIIAKRQASWLPESGYRLERTEIEETIEREREASCFFYYFVDGGPKGFWSSDSSSPYFTVFVPAMASRGYREVSRLEYARGYCRSPPPVR